ncbi:MAG: FkbM family methyltransferase [Synergistaceae bacterium]|nr:FkbM family methyltransferase [Synergistaceae bacterium]
MPVLESFRRRRARVRNGIDTGREFFLQYLDGVLRRIFRVKTSMYKNAHTARMRKMFWHEEDGTYHIKDARLPPLSDEYEKLLMCAIFDDSFGEYFYFDDKHDEATVNLCDEVFDETPYCLVDSKVNVTVEAGDIVIDAGAWIGDFAAYASAKGAAVYAFEPAERNFAILQRTAEVNKNITPVNKGLSDENTSRVIFAAEHGTSGQYSLVPNITEDHKASSSSVETIRLDDFVRENNIPRVDFIKCDIEGFERNMLAGAQETLARFAPKLALCTYHLPDDPQVMPPLIMKANPRYNIVQKRAKLFASVPE